MKIATVGVLTVEDANISAIVWSIRILVSISMPEDNKLNELSIGAPFHQTIPTTSSTPVHCIDLGILLKVRILLRLEEKDTSVVQLSPALRTAGLLDLLLLDNLLALAQTSIVPVILVTLGVPGIVVARGQGSAPGLPMKSLKVKGAPESHLY